MRGDRVVAPLRERGNTARISLVQIDLDAVDLYAVVGADEKILDPADDAGLDKVGALGVYLNGDVRRFELELLCVDEVRRTKCSVGAKVLVKLDVEFRQLRFLHAAGGKHVRDLLPADDERLVGLKLLVRHRRR